MPMDQIDPAIYDAILQGGGQIGAMDPEIERAQMLAKMLRANSKFPREARMSGRAAVAPGMLEMLGGLAQQGVAGSRENQAMEMQKQQAMLRQQQVKAALDAMRGRPSPDGMQPMDPQFERQGGV